MATSMKEMTDMEMSDKSDILVHIYTQNIKYVNKLSDGYQQSLQSECSH